MGKSLPSLSDFFNSKKANNASENILLGAGRTITSKKSSEDTEENNIANGSNTNAQKVSMLPPISLQVTIFRFLKPKKKKMLVKEPKHNPDPEKNHWKNKNQRKLGGKN